VGRLEARQFMRLRSIRGVVLLGTMLAVPFFGFAAGQSKIRPVGLYTSEGVTRAVHQGKGSGTMRIQAFSQGNAYRVQTVKDTGALKDAARPHPGDSAKRK
jgi:hypothetical protein